MYSGGQGANQKVQLRQWAPNVGRQIRRWLRMRQHLLRCEQSMCRIANCRDHL